jgi:hypothetical protein
MQKNPGLTGGQYEESAGHCEKAGYRHVIKKRCHQLVDISVDPDQKIKLQLFEIEITANQGVNSSIELPISPVDAALNPAYILTTDFRRKLKIPRD